MKPKFNQTNDAEREWIANSIAYARTLVLASRPGDIDCAMTPEVLDTAYKHWFNHGTDIVQQANDVVHAIGFAFGQFLVDHDGFEWTIGQRNSIRDSWDSKKKSPWWKLW